MCVRYAVMQCTTMAARMMHGHTFDGCLSHLDTAPRCIGSLIIEDTLEGRGKPMIPSVETLLAELYPKRGAREWLPMLTIIYKFLDVGTQMGCYQIGEHIAGRNDTDNIFHPRFVGNGTPPTNTFHAVIYERAEKWVQNSEAWCQEEAWFTHSPTFDFRVNGSSSYLWGLPVLVPTCPRKLFAVGPRKKYVDIVTDTLHASSSDLITWNTLVMLKLQWIDKIPRQWIEITTQSLEAWKTRDETQPSYPTIEEDMLE